MTARFLLSLNLGVRSFIRAPSQFSHLLHTCVHAPSCCLAVCVFSACVRVFGVCMCACVRVCIGVCVFVWVCGRVLDVCVHACVCLCECVRADWVAVVWVSASLDSLIRSLCGGVIWLALPFSPPSLLIRSCRRIICLALPSPLSSVLKFKIQFSGCGVDWLALPWI